MTVVATMPAAPPRRRRKHRLLKLTIVFVLAIAIAIAAVQAVLWSDYPRKIAINVAQNITGLRVEIDKLTLTWSGHTTIDGIRVALPLAKEPFLVVPHVDARHTSLPLIAVTLGRVAIDSATVDGVRLDVRQNGEGVWNLKQVLDQLATPGKNAAGGITQLPNLTVRDVAATITMADGRSIELKDVVVNSHREGALVWKFDAKVADVLTADGVVTPAGRWAHAANVTVKPSLLKAIEPLTGSIPAVAAARLEWAGELTPTGLTGRLTLPEKSTQAGPILASGAARLTLDRGDVSVTPDGLTITAPGVPALTLAGGTATLAGDRVTLSGIRARFAAGSVRLDGSADLTKQRGHIAAAWEQIAFPPAVVHQGRVTLEVANVWPGRPWVKGDVSVLGTVAGGTFETQAVLSGEGPAWTDTTFVVDLPVARYSRRSELRFDAVRAVVHTTADTVELTKVDVKQSTAATAKLNAYGLYRFAGPDAANGYFTAVGSGFRFGGQDNLNFSVNAWSDAHAVTLQNAYAGLGKQAWANLAGQYVFSRPEPVGMQLDIGTEPGLTLALSDTLSLAGRVDGSMKVGGTLAPTHVTLDGYVKSRGLKVDRFVIGDADLVVKGALLPDRADVRTEHLSAFGGEGWFGAQYPYFSDELTAWMGFHDIHLADIGRAVGTDRVTGTAGGKMDVTVPVGDLRRAYGQGHIEVVRPAVAPLVAAESLHIPVHVENGRLHLDADARQKAGGTAMVSAAVGLDAPTKLTLNVGLKQWLTQLPLAEFSVLTSGDVDFPQLDLAGLAGSGDVKIDQQIFAHDKPIGDIRVALHAGGRQVKLETLSGNVLGGKVDGGGSVDFADLTLGDFRASVDGLSLDRLAALDPRLTGMQGQLSARIHTHASDVEKPLGPVQADVVVASDRATYKGIEIGDARMRVFADRTRIAMDDSDPHANTIGLAGGTVRLWGRLSLLPEAARDAANPGVNAGRASAFVSVRLDEIDTEQLNDMIDPDGKPVPGRLAADVVVFGNPADIRGMSGQGNLTLTKSDLANVAPIAVLYDAMRLGIGAGKPAGEGTVNFRLTAGKMEITGFDYFNRGVYAKGALTLDNVLDLKDSPVNGYVLGTFRPLRDIKLPFFGTIDSILDALQSSATTLKIEGYMDKDRIRPTPVSLKQVTGNLKNILVGEAQAK